MVADALNCREFVELVTGYLEGALPAAAQAKMELHRRVCRDCATYLEQMRMTISVLGAMGTEPVPDRITDALLRAFRRRSRMARACLRLGIAGSGRVSRQPSGGRRRPGQGIRNPSDDAARPVGPGPRCVSF